MLDAELTSVTVEQLYNKIKKLLIPVDFADFSSSSPTWYGRANEFDTSRIPSRSRPNNKPWAVEDGASRACLIILVTTYAQGPYLSLK